VLFRSTDAVTYVAPASADSSRDLRPATTVASVVTLVAGRRSRLLSALAGATYVTASVATRFGIFEAGLASARDPKYTVVPQRERLRRRQGESAKMTG